MEGEEQKTGNMRIRILLLEPLELLGLTRPKGFTVGQFEKVLKGFKNNLSYLGAEPIGRLRLVIEANLEGRNQNQWPAPVAVYKWARDIEGEPDQEPALVVSWLQSIEGPKAIEGGYVVELRSHLRKYRKPPDEYGSRMIKSRAAENRHKLEVIRENDATGRASSDDLQWETDYSKALDHCINIVNSKC